MASKFNKDFIKKNALARIIPSTKKEAIVDLNSALAYVQERVKEFNKEDADGNDGWAKCPWIKSDVSNTLLEVNLFNMPLYWTQEEIMGRDGKPEMVTIRNADMSESHTMPRMLGTPSLNVGDRDTAKELIEELAAGTNEDLNEILERAAKALPIVLNTELPAINERAKAVYNERGKDKEYGAYGEPNEKGARADSMKISKLKQNAMNSAKQQARSDLGYARARVSAS